MRATLRFGASGLLALILMASFSALPITGEIGGDLTDGYWTSTFQCAAKNGWSFVILNSYEPYGALDPNIGNNLACAKAAGLSTDIFHSTCATQDAAAQIKNDINNVGLGNFDTMWIGVLDNPAAGCQWGSNQTANCEYVGDLISAGKNAGATVGVYSSADWWNSIVGSSCTVGSDALVHLWYANWDGKKNFIDYTSFGGWDLPNMKQYDDTVNGLCGIADGYADYR